MSSAFEELSQPFEIQRKIQSKREIKKRAGKGSEDVPTFGLHQSDLGVFAKWSNGEIPRMNELASQKPPQTGTSSSEKIEEDQ